MAREARYIVNELGKLKGSVVKIGQVMAIYGEHVLPPEITDALRMLEEQTMAVDWLSLEPYIREQLGSVYDDLDIDPVPIGAASLGQVHKARIRSSNELICLKVQYPGVAESIDTDLASVAMLLKIAKVVTLGVDFDAWLDEIRSMLKQEVDYELEAKTTSEFKQRLVDHPVFVVPTIYPRYCTKRILAASFEEGTVVTDEKVAALPQSVKNQLGHAFLDLFFKEIYVWETLQTDPNFGNYRIQFDEAGTELTRIVLLDFGAVQQYPASFLDPLKSMMAGALGHQLQETIDGAIGLGIMSEKFPPEVLNEFAELCFKIIEPLNFVPDDLEQGQLNEKGDYRWSQANLPKRIGKQAAKAAFSQYFAIPPKEFTFLSRKLLGVFAFISALDAEFNGQDLLMRYIQGA